VNKVRSAPYLAKERRTVTAIMLTIANIEEFDEKIPKKERNQVLNEVLDHIAKRIFQYEGAIAKLWEKTLLALFWCADYPRRRSSACCAFYITDLGGYPRL